MNTPRQLLAVTFLNLKAIPQRLSASLVIIIGVAVVVAVLIGILAMVAGMRQLTAVTGRTDRAIVISTGASSELMSNLPRDAALLIGDTPGSRSGRDGRGLVSAEALTMVQMPMRDGDRANLPLRGLDSAGFELRPELRVVEGRRFLPGLREVIVGRSARNQFQGLQVGNSISFRGTTWAVVGVFESNGDQHESEMITGVETLLSTFQRDSFQSALVQLPSSGAFSEFRDAISSNPALAVEVMRESDYYEEQSRTFVKVLSTVAYLVGGIMGIGATFGALNVMYSSVSGRALEIATLRALGFGPGCIVSSVLAEALLLAALGGGLGALLAWGLFDGGIVSTNRGSSAQLAVPLAVSPDVVGIGALWACMIGLIGASLPALRAVRISIASALRGA